MDRKRILVIDDEPELVAMIKLRLEASDYDMLSAGDGEEGMTMAKKEKPDLIILDIMMPKKDGYTFVKEKKIDPEIKDIPVIILTAKTKMKDLFEIEGVSDYLVKPFEANELLEKVKKHLKI